MITIEIARAFFGWCTIINLGMMLFSTIGILSLGGKLAKVHMRLFDLDQRDVSRAYFQYLAQYKIATLILNVVPYIALCLIG